tara:strand:+ start:546 stop:767 length:222 start_codon:yes stop_codon:yes gene_type:complete
MKIFYFVLYLVFFSHSSYGDKNNSNNEKKNKLPSSIKTSKIIKYIPTKGIENKSLFYAVLINKNKFIYIDEKR